MANHGKKQQSKMFAGGVLFEYTIDFLKKKNGEAAVRDLETKLGPLLFDHRKMYDAHLLFNLMHEVVDMTHGKRSEAKGYYELGRFVMKSFLKTLVGATLFSLKASPAKLLGEKFQELGDTVITFSKRKLLSIDEEKGTAVVEILGDPRPAAYFRGVIEEKFAELGYTDVEAKVLEEKDSDYKIAVNWKKK